jgi:cellulose biosynthesis protein BcsQ
LYSIKGGVGKTATSVNLAYLSAVEGFNTLLCDLDPQSSASFYFRIRSAKKFDAKKFLQGGKSINKNIKATDYPNLDLIPSDLSFRNLDLQLNKLNRSKKRLRDVLNNLNPKYDFVFFDCPPNITLVSENVFRASDFILVPVIPTTLSVLTYKKLLKFIKNSKTDNSKIIAFFSMVERRKKLHRDIIEKFENSEYHFLKSQILYSSEVEKMGIYREPLLSLKPKIKASKDYALLWKEIKELV